MRRVLVVGATIAASTMAVHAADLGVRQAPPPPVAPAPAYQPFSWTGFYFGVTAGAAITDPSVSNGGTAANTINDIALGNRPGSLGLDRTGFIGGVQAGYNWQINNNVVLGVETDFSYVDGRARSGFSGANGAFSSFQQDTNYLGTLRARAGWAMDRWMIYATGGLAYGEVKNSAAFYNDLIPGQLDYYGRRNNTRVGYTIGAGVEYAIDRNWSVKGEYLYYDLGKSNVALAQQAGAPAGGSYVARFRNDGHIVRAGLNYRF